MTARIYNLDHYRTTGEVETYPPIIHEKFTFHVRGIIERAAQVTLSFISEGQAPSKELVGDIVMLEIGNIVDRYRETEIKI